MFFLRCAFWLSIVYSTMTWTTFGMQPRDFGAHAVEAGKRLGADIANETVAGATNFCLRHAADCARDAARLTALVSTPGDPTRDARPAVIAAPDEAIVPLPVPDPRRLRDANRPSTP